MTLENKSPAQDGDHPEERLLGPPLSSLEKPWEMSLAGEAPKLSLCCVKETASLPEG